MIATLHAVKDAHYYVSFTGKQWEFPKYMEALAVLSFYEKEIDKATMHWKLTKEAFQKFCSRIDVDTTLIGPMMSLAAQPKIFMDWSQIGKTMKLSPRDYQKEAIAFMLSNPCGLLVLPCGAGKTPIGIGAYLEMRERKLLTGPGIIFVKSSLKRQWVKEVSKFSHLRAIKVRTYSDFCATLAGKIRKLEKQREAIKTSPNSDPKKLSALMHCDKEIKELEQQADKKFMSQFKNTDLYVLNYESVRDDPHVSKALLSVGAEFVYADEIQYAKSHTAARSKALYDFNKIARRFGATATPIQKNGMDIFGVFRFVDPNLFPKVKAYEDQYIVYDRYHQPRDIKNKDDLIAKISPYLFIKTKPEIASQMPKLSVMQVECEFEPLQIEMTQRLLKEAEELKEQQLGMQKNIQRAEWKNNPQMERLNGQILARQTFAQELSDSEELLLQSDSELSKKYATGTKKNHKMEKLLEIMEEVLESGERIALFTRFQRMHAVITQAIKKAAKKNPVFNTKIAYVDGTMNDSKRYQQVYEVFQSDANDCKILLLTDAGAEGLNLSKCAYLVEYEPAESYSKQTQRRGRLERADSIHQNVFVYQLVAMGSYDEIQLKVVTKKERYDSEIIHGAKPPKERVTPNASTVERSIPPHLLRKKAESPVFAG